MKIDKELKTITISQNTGITFSLALLIMLGGALITATTWVSNTASQVHALEAKSNTQQSDIDALKAESVTTQVKLTEIQTQLKGIDVSLVEIKESLKR